MDDTIHVPVSEGNKQKNNGSATVWVIAILVVAALGYLVFKQANRSTAPTVGQQAGPEMTEMEKSMVDAGVTDDASAIDVQTAWLDNFKSIDYTYRGQLADVAGGNASGTASADVVDGAYHLYASFANLPAPEDGYFYEGWVVRKSPFDVVSTGVVTEHSTQTVNAYLSRENLLDHTFYVLTLEPDDGNPAPAGHVLEGTLVQQ